MEMRQNSPWGGESCWLFRILCMQTSSFKELWNRAGSSRPCWHLPGIFSFALLCFKIMYRVVFLFPLNFLYKFRCSLLFQPTKMWPAAFFMFNPREAQSHSFPDRLICLWSFCVQSVHFLGHLLLFCLCCFITGICSLCYTWLQGTMLYLLFFSHNYGLKNASQGLH